MAHGSRNEAYRHDEKRRDCAVIAITIAATILPACRAIRVDPATILKAE
jgi:hypothetical protein